ncbi:MAG: inactive transglutaminase family protein [Gammaproteobacteria bacterium]|nr:inactive transglutaminase family protein [Gammaproteobacteria bacterium]
MSGARLVSWLLVAALLLLGGGIAWLRHVQLEIPFLPGDERPVWLVEARVDFLGTGGSARVALDLPEDPPGFRLISEQAASPGYGFSIITGRDGDRRGEWTRRQVSGPQALYYTAQFLVVDGDPARIPVVGRPRPREPDFEEPAATAARELIAVAVERSSHAESLTRELTALLAGAVGDQNAALLRASVPDPAVLLAQLLNHAGVAARVSQGIELEDARRRRPLTSFVEIPVDGQWRIFDPVTGRQGLPENVLLWHRGGESLLDVEGGRRSQVTFSMLRQSVPALELSQDQFGESWLAAFGIAALPIEEQGLFKLLFLLPLGALVVAFMRIIVGVPTSGTFMPVLIALAFLQTSLGLGLLSFITVVGFGLILRNYLSHLNLLLVARIATLVVIVVLLISMLSVLGYRFGISTGLTITFFPMVIIAWTIERMSILWEEEGPSEVLIQGGGSLVVAVLAFLLMDLRIVQHLSFNFPELNLVLLAGILVIGQYSGYRLSELRRFRDMAGLDR